MLEYYLHIFTINTYTDMNKQKEREEQKDISAFELARLVFIGIPFVVLGYVLGYALSAFLIGFGMSTNLIELEDVKKKK